MNEHYRCDQTGRTKTREGVAQATEKIGRCASGRKSTRWIRRPGVTHGKEAGAVRGWKSEHYQGCQKKVGKDSRRRKNVGWICQTRGDHHEEARIIRSRETKYRQGREKAV